MNLGILFLFGNEPRELYPTPLLASPFVCLPGLFCFSVVRQCVRELAHHAVVKRYVPCMWVAKEHGMVA